MHGLSKIDSGELSVNITRYGKQMDLCVLNSGIGLESVEDLKPAGHGVGLANVLNRLKLHYGEEASLSMAEVGANQVRVTIRLPLQFSTDGSQPEAASLIS